MEKILAKERAENETAESAQGNADHKRNWTTVVEHGLPPLKRPVRDAGHRSKSMDERSRGAGAATPLLYRDHHWCFRPAVLKVVERAELLVEDVDHHVIVIEQNPARHRLAFNVEGVNVAFA